MSGYFAYLRISTPKQGEGVSLQEQRAAIERHAGAHAVAAVISSKEWGCKSIECQSGPKSAAQ